MASPTGSSSTVKRLRSTASARLTAGLLSSSSKVATIGLVTALLTLAFAIAFGVALRHQSEVGAPLSHSVASLDAAINESLAALRGWIAYGDEEAPIRRKRIWDEEIIPNLEKLRSLAPLSDVPGTSERVQALSARLREIEHLQWAIEDVARTPGNLPARVAYDQVLEPLRINILAGLGVAIERLSDLARSAEAIHFLTRLARFRSAFSQGDRSVAALVREFDEVRANRAIEKINLARSLSKEIEAEFDDYTEGDLRELISFVLGEFRAYEVQAPDIVALRRSPSWNVAQQIAVDRGMPLILATRTIASDLTTDHSRASEANAERLTRASYLVIAMALLMGLLSGGSLFVSHRLERQLQDVQARAKRLGQYEIERRIGRGGMGEVFLAHHSMLRRPAALKLLRPGNAADLRAQARFQREVQLTCQLSHPNTIEIFDYGRTPEGAFYYAMELIEGVTIERLVELAGPLPPARVRHILLQICASLQEAHDKALLHRDIKPSNIMLTEQGGRLDAVKVMDFGLVKDLAGDPNDPVEGRDAIVGTPQYLAPEVILSSATASPASDLYALGAVGYFMLTGTPIFPDGDVVEILERQIAELIPFPSERLGAALPNDLEYVVMACLAKDPGDRPASASSLVEMLEACDCGAWTPADAQIWWDEYGEAAMRGASTDSFRSAASRSALEVAIDGSRG